MFPVRKSCIRSWKAGIDAWSGEVLERVPDLLEKCRIIYHTRHKACYLIPEEVSGLPYKAVYKSYFEKRFFRYLFRFSLAYREYLGFKRAFDAGIPVAEVLALGEKRSGLRLKEAFFITRYLEDFRDGGEFFPGKGGDETLKDEFIRQNLSLLAKLHKSGYVHGCFHALNELFRLDEEGKMTVVWIDLASVIPTGKSRKLTESGDLERFLKDFGLPAEKKAEYQAYYRAMRSN